MVPLPPKAFASHKLATISEDPSGLLRVGRHASGEPHFGRTGANRFDDPRVPETVRFGTCYLGRNIVVAIAETVLHDEIAVDGQFKVALDELKGRYVVAFSGPSLTLADCTGVALKRMGLDGNFSTALSYAETQQWAVAIHDHPQKVDGFLYMSRHINDGYAAVVFDRTKAKLQMPRYQRLLGHPGAKAALDDLHVSAI